MTRNSRFLSLLVAGLCMSGAVQAQQSSTVIKGRVTDSATKNPKVGVTVTITNPTTNFTRSMVTDSQGRFGFLYLPVGQYNITFASGGQSYKASRTGLLGQEIDASFKWPAQTGALVEVVAVSSLTQTIDTTTAQIGTSVTAETLSDLPTVARDINQAAILAPGIQLVAGSAVDPTKKSSSYIQTGEGQGRGTNFALDGADNNSTDVGGYVLAMPFDAVGELQVVTNQYKAEFGKSTSGFFNVVSKSGTNDFSGVVSGQYQNQSMRARSTDELEKGKSNQSIYSATLLGPIIKDKLFFMISAEQTSGKAPSDTFTPYALSQDPTLGGINYELTKKSVYTKLDWLINQDMNASFNWGYSQDTTANQPFPRTSTYNKNVLTAALGTGENQTWKIGGKLTWTLSASAVWESTMSYFDYKNGIAPHDGGPYTGAPTAIIDIDTPTFPRDEIATEQGWGGQDPNAFQNTGIKRFTWKNDVTFTFGDHTVKTGFDYNLSHYADQTLFFGETGVYAMRVAGNGLTYANAHLASAMDPDQNVQRFSVVANGFQNGISFKQYGFYLQDDWNVTPKLSLYAGFRIDADTQLDYLKQYDGMYAAIRANTLAWSGTDVDHPTANPVWNSGKAPRGKTYFAPRVQGVFRPNADDTFTLKFGVGKFVAQTIDNVIGFSRSLGNRANGLPSGSIYNQAFQAFNGLEPRDSGYFTDSFHAGATGIYVNGHEIVLPVSLTPYNYANNVGGLRDYFRNTVDGWLTTATADTDGKSLMASNFEYPTSWMYNIGAAYRISDRQAVEANLILTKTKNLSVQGNLDGSGPDVYEYDTAGNEIFDTVFYSNQTATSWALQMKYAYTSPNTNFIATLSIKDTKSSNGGGVGSFDNSGGTDFYGSSSTYSYKTSPERRSPGSDKFSGSFSYSHRFSFGTMVSLLGQWHSGKAYDVTEGYPVSLGPNNDPYQYNPIEFGEIQEGAWAMNVDMKLSHKFHFGKKISVEPFILMQNIFNSFDYAANYDGARSLNNGDPNSNFGNRFAAWSYNTPRTGVVGVRVTF